DDRPRIGTHRVVHIPALRVEQERRGRSLIAQLHQRRPAVGAVLLPEGAVRLEAADVLLSLPHDLQAMAQRAGRASLDAVGIGIEPHTQQRVALSGQRAKTFEVTQAWKW